MDDDDYIGKFIRENRERFTVYKPPENHKKRFLLRLNLRVRHVISIVPNLVKVAVVTLLIFTASLMIWNNFIRWDRDYVPLKYKIYGMVDRIFS